MAGAGGGESTAEVSVVVGALEDASGWLDQIERMVREFPNVDFMSTMDAAAGDAETAEAIGSFVSRWRYGLSCMGADIKSLAVALREAAGAYQKVEASITAAEGG